MLTHEQKELAAAKALAVAKRLCVCPDCWAEFGKGFLRDLDNVQIELAKVGLAIQPIKINDELLARIQDYLGSGGLFNPEMMEHDKVRDLIMDCRKAIQPIEKEDK